GQPRHRLYPLVEEELELARGGLGRVAAVHDVLSDLGGVVASDGARSGGERIRRAHERSTRLDRALSRDLRDDDRAAGDEVDELSEERLLTMLAVVFLGGLARDGHHPHLLDPEALCLDTPDH